MGINKEVLAVLLESSEGPVGRFVENKAIEVRDRARGYAGGNADGILHRAAAAGVPILESINYELEGTTATIGIYDYGPGSMEEYLADKELREMNWLFPAAAWTFVPND